MAINHRMHPDESINSQFSVSESKQQKDVCCFRDGWLLGTYYKYATLLPRFKGNRQTPRKISACEKTHSFLQHLSESTPSRNTAKWMLSWTTAKNGTAQSFLKFLKNSFIIISELVRLWNAGANEKTIMVMISWNLYVSINKVHNVLDCVYEKDTDRGI